MVDAGREIVELETREKEQEVLVLQLQQEQQRQLQPLAAPPPVWKSQLVTLYLRLGARALHSSSLRKSSAV